MESPDNRRDITTTKFLSPPNETSSARNDLNLIKLVAKGVFWNYPNKRILVAFHKLNVRPDC